MSQEIEIKEVEVLEQESANERGASMVEYAIMVALVAATAITAFTTLGTRVTATIDTANTALSN